MKIEVLVATMNQKNLEKYKEMNLNSDAILMNQDDRWEYKEENINGKKVKIITTSDRGVGKNRNKGLAESDADICILADDDMRYEDNYAEIVSKAFEELPNADIIVFNITTVGVETRKRRMNKQIKKINLFNCLNYGAARITFRREEILKKNIWFSILYGGGAKYSSGEDSLFLLEAIRKGLNVYVYPANIAYVKQEESTWFKGYNEKYFFDKGVWIANAFPKIKNILVIYFAFKLKNKTNELNFKKIFKIMKMGIKKFEECTLVEK
ncbi:glycosyltransferase family 2 protein [uncultured Clostridium sp.]|uniref:glycosyltransferase n=1 Tax=uncultured Clostridium sp. TaxID=59620 RepID=UPI00262B6CC9|nr:glycosyltransferase family 2 protein [uncultured Clostridium sp.]